MYPRAGLSFLLEIGMEVSFVPPLLRVPRSGRVVEIVQQAGESYLVHFDSIDSIGLAEQLQGHSCLVRKADLPEDFARSTYDLVGFTILDIKDIPIGAIVDIEENPAHPLLVAELPAEENASTMQDSSARTAQIPLVEDFIIEINEDEKKLVLNLPDGLLDL